MVDYVEFPADPVVNVHWKKKKDNGDTDTPPKDYRVTCGAFQLGILHGIPLLSSGIFVLSTYHMYLLTHDQSVGHLPNKPYAYATMFTDYMWFTQFRSLPYIWSLPQGWSLLWINPQTAPAISPVGIRVYRNCNPQVFQDAVLHGGLAPDFAGGFSAYVPSIGRAGTGTEVYDPIVVFELTVYGARQFANYPQVFVQAHCQYTTAGQPWPGTDNDAGTPDACLSMMPPQPAGWGSFFDPWSTVEYPARGSTDEPLKPPGPGTRREEPRRPLPPELRQNPVTFEG